MIGIRKDRVQARLDKLGASAFAVALAMGRGRNFVDDFLRGKKESIGRPSWTSLAVALECSVEYLTGDSKEIGIPPISAARVVKGSVPLRGIVYLGIFWPIGSLPALPAGLDAKPISPSIQYPKTPQVAYVVGDKSLIGWRVSVSQGMVLVCTEVAPGEEIRNGALVVVERTRGGGKEIETSAREFQRVQGSVELRPPSAKSAIEPILLRDGKALPSGETVKIVGVVRDVTFPS